MIPYYQDKHCTIYHGDCREILPTLPKVDLVVTDPPYAISGGGVHRGAKGRGSRSFDFFPGDDDHAGMVELVCDAISKSVVCMADHASMYAWVGHREIGPIVSLMEQHGFSTRMLAWVKSCPAPPPPGAGWPSAFEVCVFAWRPGRTWTHDGKNAPRSNVFVADSYRHGQPGKLDHPTQKPPAVVSPLIQASSLVGQTVLDPFMGSGTTLRAAKDLGRKAIGIELEEKYCEIAANRMRQEVLF